MKTIRILLLVIIIAACKQNTEQQNINTDLKGATTYTYKVSGLDDSVTADSVWKIMFVYPEIESIVLDNKDSLVVIKTGTDFKNVSELEAEIEKRGASILKKLN